MLSLKFLQVPLPQTWSLTPFLMKRSQGSGEKWLIPRVGTVKMNMTEMLRNTTTVLGAYQRETADDVPNILERTASGPNWNDLHNKVNSNVPAYYLKYRINAHELTQI